MSLEAKFIAEGRRIEHTPSGADVAAGDVVVVGDLIAIATDKIVDGVRGSLAIEGIFSMPKAVTSGSALGIGTKVYWDNGNSIVSTTAGSNKVAGYTMPKAGRLA